MPSLSSIIKTVKLMALICLLPASPGGRAQTPPEPKPKDQADVLRVYTELVQTDVMVFDKQGRFVNDLKREDFELRIDGKLKPIEFFEKVTAGSTSEESQLAAARGSSKPVPSAKSPGPAPLDRGRPVFFYVDDLHLDLASLNMTRKLINEFIEKEMGQNDEAAVTSASGQIGFLQQLTDNKTVLRSALDRLKIRPYSVSDFDRPTMSEYQALLIDQYDREVRNFFIDETLRINPGLPRDAAEAMVTGRAANLLRQAARTTLITLAGLGDLVSSARTIPGRKLVFFISGGFFLDDRNSDSVFRLRKITSDAAKSGVVIYSMDARGLVSGMSDASTDAPFDPTGRLQRASMGELTATQDGLNALARDTGGKAFFNSNSLGPALGRALKETASYYLLAWKPEHQTKATKFRRIEVKIPGRPELNVQVRRGFFDLEPATTADTNKKSTTERDKTAKSPAEELQKVIKSPYPDHQIPVSVSLNYVNTPQKRIMLSTLMQVPTQFLSFEPENGKQVAIIEVGGVVFNDRGQVGARFNDRLTLNAASIDAARKSQDLAYGHTIFLPSGLYHVRVAARDQKSGRAGSAHAWIEIPNLSSGQLALSSVLTAARPQPHLKDAGNSQEVEDPIQLIAHNLSAEGDLRFAVFIYNAATAPVDSKPDLAIQIQLIRDNQPVVTTPLKKVSTEGIQDLGRIPYAAQISLSGLPAGRYLLQLTVVDRVAKSSASQQTRFEIE